MVAQLDRCADLQMNPPLTHRTVLFNQFCNLNICIYVQMIADSQTSKNS